MRVHLAPPANNTPSLRSSIPVSGAKRTWHKELVQSGGSEGRKALRILRIHSMEMRKKTAQGNQANP